VQPLRGEVWDVALPRIGEHPGVVLTVNALRGRIQEVTVVLVTGTAGPAVTHVPVGGEAGLTRYPESYVCATTIVTVPSGRLRRRRGLLAAAELAAVEDAVRTVLGL
jgi:mRNA interferase MazF